MSAIGNGNESGEKIVDDALFYMYIFFEIDQSEVKFCVCKYR